MKLGICKANDLVELSLKGMKLGICKANDLVELSLKGMKLIPFSGCS